MWKKLINILLASMFFVSAVLVFPVVKVQAVGVDTVVKAVGGKAVVRAVSEKAGLALSPKQLDNVVSVIEKKSYDGDQKSIDFLNKANAIDMLPVSSTPAEKTGFKKYVLDPVLWLTGADLIFEAINAFKDGYDTSQPVEMFKACVVSSYEGVTIPAGLSYFTLDDPTWGKYLYVYDEVNSNLVYPAPGDTDGFQIQRAYTTGTYYRVITYKYNGTSWIKESDVNATASATGTSSGVVGKTYDPFKETVCAAPVVEDDVVDTAPVSPVVLEKFDNDTYDNSTTYNIEVEMPDDYSTHNYDNDTTVWNAPDPELELEVNDDDDGDGVKDGDDAYPEDPDRSTPDPNNDDGNGDAIDVLVRVDDPIPIHEKFFLEMADMGQKVEDMYNGVVHFFDVTIDGFGTLTSGMTGFVAFLDDFFDWLPSEYVALLGSGFTLGVVSFFLRR